MAMSGLGMLMWWHEFSMSAIALADNLIFPSKFLLWYWKTVIFYLSKGTLDIFLKNLIAGLYPFGMHVTSNKSSKINLREFWWVRCICTDELLLVTQSNFCNVSLNGNYLAIWEEI